MSLSIDRSLSDIPVKLHENIYQFLPIKDIVSCALLSKHFNSTAQKHLNKSFYCRLPGIPIELHDNIYQFLPAKDIVSCALLSKHFKPTAYNRLKNIFKQLSLTALGLAKLAKTTYTSTCKEIDSVEKPALVPCGQSCDAQGRRYCLSSTGDLIYIFDPYSTLPFTILSPGKDFKGLMPHGNGYCIFRGDKIEFWEFDESGQSKIAQEIPLPNDFTFSAEFPKNGERHFAVVGSHAFLLNGDKLYIYDLARKDWHTQTSPFSFPNEKGSSAAPFGIYAAPGQDYLFSYEDGRGLIKYAISEANTLDEIANHGNGIVRNYKKKLIFTTEGIISYNNERSIFLDYNFAPKSLNFRPFENNSFFVSGSLFYDGKQLLNLKTGVNYTVQLNTLLQEHNIPVPLIQFYFKKFNEYGAQLVVFTSRSSDLVRYEIDIKWDNAPEIDHETPSIKEEAPPFSPPRSLTAFEKTNQEGLEKLMGWHQVTSHNPIDVIEKPSLNSCAAYPDEQGRRYFISSQKNTFYVIDPASDSGLRSFPKGKEFKALLPYKNGYCILREKALEIWEFKKNSSSQKIADIPLPDSFALPNNFPQNGEGCLVISNNKFFLLNGSLVCIDLETKESRTIEKEDLPFLFPASFSPPYGIYGEGDNFFAYELGRGVVKYTLTDQGILESQGASANGIIANSKKKIAALPGKILTYNPSSYSLLDSDLKNPGIKESSPSFTFGEFSFISGDIFYCRHKVCNLNTHHDYSDKIRSICSSHDIRGSILYAFFRECDAEKGRMHIFTENQGNIHCDEVILTWNPPQKEPVEPKPQTAEPRPQLAKPPKSNFLPSATWRVEDADDEIYTVPSKKFSTTNATFTLVAQIILVSSPVFAVLTLIAVPTLTTLHLGPVIAQFHGIILTLETVIVLGTGGTLTVGTLAIGSVSYFLSMKKQKRSF